MASRVVITGLGVISPIGIGVSEFWKSAMTGRSGVTAIPSLGWAPMSDYRSRVAGQVYNFSPKETSIIRSVTFRLNHGINPDQVKEILESSIAGLSDIRGIPSPLAYISDANENFIAYKLIFNIDNYGAQYVLGDKVYRKGFEALQAAGIKLARPYLELYNTNATATPHANQQSTGPTV